VLPASGMVVLMFGSFDGRALTYPIDLYPGAAWEAKFRVTRGVRYVVLLEVDSTIPRRRLQCLLGEVPFQPPCPIDRVVDLEWTLRRGSQQVASGESSHAAPDFGPDRAMMLIGQFEASAGAVYILELVSRSDGSMLAAANPRVVVQFHPEVNKGFHILAPLIAFATVLASLPLAVMALGAAWGRRKPR
jgi:hypothetical protein